MRFQRAGGHLNNYSDDDEEWISTCGRWRLVVPHEMNPGGEAHYCKEMPRRHPTQWILYDEHAPDPEDSSAGEIGAFPRRRDAVAKAKELAASTLLENIR